MKIPGTQKIEAGEVAPGNASNELFCNCIQNLTGDTYLKDFLEHISTFLPDFVFSKETLALLQNHYDTGKTSKTPLEKAKEFLQKTKEGNASSSGEFAEFLLFLFAKEVKGAHKLVSRIQSRGSANMTIPGRDCVFVYKDECNNVYMLLGEAKGKPDSNDGLREAQTDMNAFWSSGNIQHEINLASTHLRSELTAENASLYEAYFIDDNPKHAELKYKNVILIAYSHSAVIDLVGGTINLSDFQDRVIADLKRCFANQQGVVAASPHPNIYCFIPFEDIDIARTAFAELHNTVR